MKIKRMRLVWLPLAVGLFGVAIATAQNRSPQGRGGFRGRGRGFPGRGYYREVPPGMKVLLAWADTRNGIAQHASTSHALAVIEEMGYQTGAYFTYIRTDSAIIAYHPKMTTGQPASGGPSLANINAIFFMGHRQVPIDTRQKADLLKFVRNGGGFVAAHVASTALLNWPEFGNLLGGRYDGHPWGITNAHVIVVDPTFPAMKFFPTQFDFHDEFYQIKDFASGDSRVLMCLDTSGLDMTRRGVHPADAPYPLTWAKTYGKGRVFYSALGHAASTWDNPEIRRMWFNAIEWALGVTNANVSPNHISSCTPSAIGH
jgi:type 1 glutamine amidotransferase